MRGGQRLRIGHVQRRTGNLPFKESLAEGFRIDHGATCRIDQHGCAFHLAQHVPVNQTMGSRSKRHVQAEKIRLLNHPLKRDPFSLMSLQDFVSQRMKMTHQDAHTKTPSPTRHRLSDPSKTHNPERRTKNIPSQQYGRTPGLPQTVLHVFHPLNHPTGRRHQQGKSQIGAGLGQHPGRIPNGDAPFGTRRKINVVEPHRHGADHSKSRRPGQQGRIHAVGQQAEQPFSVSNSFRQRRGRHRSILRPHVALRKLPYRLHGDFG